MAAHILGRIKGIQCSKQPYWAQVHAFLALHLCCQHSPPVHSKCGAQLTTLACANPAAWENHAQSSSEVLSQENGNLGAKTEDTGLQHSEEGAISGSRGRLLRDPKEWVWLPSVPKALTHLQHGGPSSNKLGAFQWLRKCHPELPHAAIHKLFRKREVRLVERQDSPHQAALLRRISEDDKVPAGSILVIHSKAMEQKATKSRQSEEVSQAPQKWRTLDKTTQESRQAPEVLRRDAGGATQAEVQDLRDRVLYRDEHMLVLNKAHGLAVQGGRSVSISLDDLIVEAFAGGSNGERPRLVHRLDRDTSGCLVVALSEPSAVALTAMFRQKTAETIAAQHEGVRPEDSVRMQRTYWALVDGIPAKGEGVIDAPLAKRDNRGKGERVVLANPTDKDALPASTEYRIVAVTPQGLACLEMKPLTGRKHQLRVHAGYCLSCPIVGDYKYGYAGPHLPGKGKDGASAVLDAEKGWGRKTHKKPGIATGDVSSGSPHLHLHCRSIELPRLRLLDELAEEHISKRMLEKIRVEAPLPPHMKASWKALGWTDAA